MRQRLAWLDCPAVSGGHGSAALEAEAKNFRSWDGLLSHYRTGGKRRWSGWMFRGQRNADWDLKSSLERAVVDRFGKSSSGMPDIESRLVREFQRQAHQFIPDVPKRDEMLEWLGLMQHWGAPTRLVDWTYSFYAAAFFAVADAQPDDKVALWAIDFRWCRKRATELVRSVRGVSGRVQLAEAPFQRPSVAGVFPATPFRLHERLGVQQGTFLVPGDAGLPFMTNLAAMEDVGDKVRVEKLCLQLTPRRLEQALHELRRMNLTHASLYPGLEGFARRAENLIPDLARMPIATEEW